MSLDHVFCFSVTLLGQGGGLRTFWAGGQEAQGLVLVPASSQLST